MIKIFVDLPDTDAREAIFRLELSQRPYEKTMNFTALAIKSEGLSCADIVEDIIESVSREAANRDLDEINELQIIEKIIQTKNSN